MLKYFKPQNINSKKIRLGSERDGGYVASEIILEKCVALFTYGYGGDKSYEDDFILKYKKPNYLFDHTVQQENWDNGIQHFISEGLGKNNINAEKESELINDLLDKKNSVDLLYLELKNIVDKKEDYVEELPKEIVNPTTLEELLAAKDLLDKKINQLQKTNIHENRNISGLKKIKNELNNQLNLVSELVNKLSVKDVREHYNRFDIQGDIFLKIDTEGAEYDYFLNVDIDDLASFTCGLIIEVHWLEQESNQIKFFEMMEKINKHFILVHVHGNNWGEEFDYQGFKVPRVPEFTFINKRYVTDYSPDNQDYPIVGIDFPNNPNLPECDLTFLKQL
jgi:hypothetical protein